MGSTLFTLFCARRGVLLMMRNSKNPSRFQCRGPSYLLLLDFATEVQMLRDIYVRSPVEQFTVA